MTRVKNPGVDFKIVPENLEVFIGKSTVENIPDYQLVDIDYQLAKTFNRLIKRIFDFILALPLLIITIPVWLIVPFLKGQKKISLCLPGVNKSVVKVRQLNKLERRSLINNILLLPFILAGYLSFVGSPLVEYDGRESPFYSKPGITGLIQINDLPVNKTEDLERFEFYYIKNQSIWLDLEILIKSILS